MFVQYDLVGKKSTEQILLHIKHVSTEQQDRWMPEDPHTPFPQHQSAALGVWPFQEKRSLTLLWPAEGPGSGRGDVRGLHDDAGSNLVGVSGGRRRVLAVGRRPAVAVVADEGGRVPSARHSEVGLVGADERGHAGKSGNPENCRGAVLPPDGTLQRTGEKEQLSLTR